MKDNQLIPHLFRTEFSKIVAVLCKTFGLSNLQLAEDITSDTFLKATETWGLKGVPKNPKAWLYTVAKNNAKDYFKRKKIFQQKIKPQLQDVAPNENGFEIDLSETNITDSQLKMLFAVCHPILSKKEQISLALRILCGFGIKEITTALLSKPSTIKKRLQRAKQTLRKNNIELIFPAEDEMLSRLNNVLSILYLLFNEGYYSSSSEKSIKKEMCLESMRLLYLLLHNDTTNNSTANALMALFCFHSSRFNARTNDNGELILYNQQDKEKWNLELIKKGEYYLQLSSKGTKTKYHLEALIAFWHTKKTPNQAKKWNAILKLYNQLIQIEYSPITALNRTYALAKANGKEEAITEALKINLDQNHLYHSLLANLYHGVNSKKEKEYLEKALKLVSTKNDKKVLLDKLKKLTP